MPKNFKKKVKDKFGEMFAVPTIDKDCFPNI